MMQLTEFFKTGEKHCQTGCIGLEVEHFILHKETRKPMPYEGNDSISFLMEQLSNHFAIKHYEQERLIGLEDHWVLITLEPGCQLEVSLACIQNLEKIKNIYIQTMALIQSYLEPINYEIVYSGGLPNIMASEVVRIDKKRYEYMEEHFLKVGTRGLEMMKATAAVHVSIDYSDEQDFIQKYRMANILHPVFAFLTHNTLRYQGKPNSDVLLRDSIWKHTDSDRCGIIPSLFDEDFGYSSYSSWLASIPLIVMNDHNQFIKVPDQTIEEASKTYGWGSSQISHYLSMSFLDIRLKRFIEIRSADSMPIEYTIAYCALLKGLFYQEKTVKKYSQITKSIQEIEQAKESFRQYNWDATIYQKNAQEWIQELIDTSKKGLSNEEIQLLKPLEQLVNHKTHIYQENL